MIFMFKSALHVAHSSGIYSKKVAQKKDKIPDNDHLLI